MHRCCKSAADAATPPVPNASAGRTYIENMETTANKILGGSVAANIGAGTCFPFSLGGIAPGTAVIVGRSANAGNLGDSATYLGHTLDGLAVVQFDGITVDLGAGPGVEEWPAEMVESLQAAA